MDFAETEPMVVATTETAEVDAGDAEAEVAAVEEPAASEDLAVNVGAELYNKQCMACHATGLLNAPKFGDAEAWAPRIEKGVETLTTHSAEGFNQMPAQAYNGVTEDQIRAAVEYMIAEAS
ncbi:MAG: cytochrome c5 family protein [Psychrobacter sp.]|nr:cytochrome c5 family protein [Psychrobacter sp.]